jgi:hypothetical protein
MNREPESEDDYKDFQRHELYMATTPAKLLTLECIVCGRVDQGLELSATGTFIQKVYDGGWRYKESERLRLIGPMCPKCVATPDAERGKG